MGEGGERHGGHHGRPKRTDRYDNNETEVCQYDCKCTGERSTRKDHFTEKHLSSLRRVRKLAIMCQGHFLKGVSAPYVTQLPLAPKFQKHKE